MTQSEKSLSWSMCSQCVVHSCLIRHRSAICSCIGKNNVVADLLSRWQYTVANVTQLQALVNDPVWLSVSMDMLEIDHTL